MAYMLVIKLVCKPGAEGQFREKYQWMADQMKELLPGVTTFQAFQSPDNPLEWRCIEVFSNEQVFQRHVTETEEIKKVADGFHSLVESGSAELFVEGDAVSEFAKERMAAEGGKVYTSGWAGFVLNPRSSMVQK